jgi:RNA polymerase sigma-70 factor (ECF subfamily)
MAQPLNLEPGLKLAEASEPGDLLERARSGDTEAFGELCRAYESRLLRQAHALCESASLAEELAQDTLVEAWKSLRRYNGRCRFFTWLCAILLHRHRNTLRQKRPLPWSALARPQREEFAAQAGNQPAVEAWPDAAAQSRERAALVRRCVAALPRKHQQVIHLRFYADDSLEGIAAALGCSLGTVKSRLFHALEKLRRMRELGEDLPSSTMKIGEI